MTDAPTVGTTVAAVPATSTPSPQPGMPGNYVRLTVVASLLGISIDRVKRMSAAGVFKTAYKRGPLEHSPIYVERSEVEKLAQFYRSTVTASEAAALVGVNRTTIIRWYNEHLIGGGLDPFDQIRVNRADLAKYNPQLIEMVD